MVLTCHFLFSFSVCLCCFTKHLGLFLKGRKGLIQGFGELTLCGCVTVMAVGYRAQGQGGSKEMYFYSCFQDTVLVQRLMSQERCKPPSNESPSPGQKALSRSPQLSPQKMWLFLRSAQTFLTQRAKGQHILFVCGHWGTKEQKSTGVVCGAYNNSQKVAYVIRPTCKYLKMGAVCYCNITWSDHSMNIKVWLYFCFYLQMLLFLFLNFILIWISAFSILFHKHLKAFN